MMLVMDFLFSAVLYIFNILAMGIFIHSVLNLFLDNNDFEPAAVPVIGIAVYSLYVFFTGYFIGLNLAILNAPLLLIFRYPREMGKLLNTAVGSFKHFFLEREDIFFKICLTIILSLTFLRIFGTRILNDSLVYHLYLPKQYVDMGRIFRVPFSEHALWPQLTGMFFTLALKFKSIAAANFFSFLTYLFIGILTFLLTRVITEDRRISVLSAVFTLATPVYFFYAAAAYIDLTAVMFIVAMIYFLFKYYDCQKAIYIFIAAIACGGALSCKYVYIIAPISAILVMLFKSQGRKKIYDTSIFILVCLAVCSAWYLRSWIESGNPIFPFGHNLFNKGFPSDARPEEMTVLGRLVGAVTGNTAGAGTGILNFIMLPFNLTFRGSLFGEAKTGFLLLLLLPFFIYSIFISGRARVIHYFVIVYVVFWFLLDQMARFLLPVFPLYIAVSFLGVKSLFRIDWAKKMFFALAIPMLIFQTAWSAYYFYQDFEYIFKGKAREDYSDYSYGLGKFLRSQHISNDKKILLVGDNKVFYLPDNTIRENTFRNFTRYDTMPDRIACLKKYGIGYILINTGAAGKEGAYYDPVNYFCEEVDKTLFYIARYKDTYEFILCELK